MAGAGSRAAGVPIASGKAASLKESRGGVCGELTAEGLEPCATRRQKWKLVLSDEQHVY